MNNVNSNSKIEGIPQLPKISFKFYEILVDDYYNNRFFSKKLQKLEIALL